MTSSARCAIDLTGIIFVSASRTLSLKEALKSLTRTIPMTIWTSRPPQSPGLRLHRALPLLQLFGVILLVTIQQHPRRDPL